MKTLLLAIQAALRAEMAGVREADIYITPHENYIPPGVKAPAIGIKDGAVRVMEKAGMSQETRIQVSFVVWVEFFQGEESIIGRANQDGVLDICSDLHGVLAGDTLGVTGVIWARPVSETASEMFGDGSRGLQRKIITYEYEREENLWGSY